MKRYLKRISALVLAMIMVLSVCTVAFASNAGTDGVFGTQDDRGTITVQGVDAEDQNVTAVAYQIIKANYDNGGNFSGYEALYDGISAEPDENNKVNVTEDQLSAILKSNKVADTSYDMSGSNGTFTADVPVGSYLVVFQNAETKIYSPVVVSVSYTNASGTGNTLTEGNVTITNGEAWVKVRETPVLDKIIDADSTDENNKGNTANIGDPVSYTLTTTIPYYGGSHPKFEITDQLTGLTFKDGLTVKAGETVLAAGKDYTVTDPITSEFTINFVVNDAYTLNQYQGQTLEIKYNATINDDAAVNQNANTNDATLTYSKDSTQSGKDGTSESKTKTYTFDIDAAVEGSVTDKILTKVGEEVIEGKKKPLSGAEFTLYSDSSCINIYSNPVFNGVVFSNNSGQLPIKGLKQGTYYLKETKAPDGYSLLNTVYTITIDATINDAGDLTSWTINVNGETINNSDGVTSEFTVNNGTATVKSKSEVEIPNTKLSELPSTGGIGTYLFTIVGVIIMAVAAGIFFMKRRRSAE